MPRETLTLLPEDEDERLAITGKPTRLSDGVRLANPQSVALTSPMKSARLSQGVTLTRGHDVNVEEDEEEGVIDWVKDVAIDLALFGAAAKTGSAVGGLIGGPPGMVVGGLVGGGLYAGAKHVQEELSGREQQSLTEVLSGSDFSPAGRAASHVAENALFMGAGGPVIKVVSKATGEVLRGVDKVSSGLLTKAGNATWAPVADWAWDNIWVKTTHIPLPYKEAGLTKRRTVRELMQPAVERLGKSGNIILKGAARAVRTAEMNKRRAMEISDVVSNEMKDMTLGETIQFGKGLREPNVVKSDKVKAALKKFRESEVTQNLDGLYELTFNKKLGNKLWTRFEGDSEALMKLYNPKYAHILEGKYTKETKKAILELMHDPRTDNNFRVLLRDLYAMPAQFPRDVYKAAREAHTAFIVDKFVMMRGLVSTRLKPGYEVCSVGKLKGKCVPRDVELQLRDMAKIETLANTFGSQMMSLWKMGKTIWRPAYHGRNLISNVILNDMGGLPWYRTDVYGKALKMMRSNDKEWVRFKDQTLLGTFSDAEVNMMFREFNEKSTLFDLAWKLARKTSKLPTKMQNYEENWFKFAKYLHNRGERGMSVREAIADAQKHLLNYGEASLGAAGLRSGVIGPMPFSTWFTKIIPLTIETGWKHPLRMGKWIGFGWGVQNYALEQVGLTREEWDNIEKDMPQYMANSLKLLVPWRDEQGRLGLFNASFLVPGLGDLAELRNLLNFTSSTGMQLHNPVHTVISSLASKQKPSGAPLYEDWEDQSVKFAKAGQFVLEQMMPAVTPGVGTDFNVLWKAINEDNDAPSMSQAALSTFGFKVRPLDPIKMKRTARNLRELHEREIMQEFRSEMKDATSKNKSSAEREKIIAKYKRLRLENVQD